MTTPDPMPWSALVLAAWPLWFALLVLAVLSWPNQVAAALAWMLRWPR